MIDAPLDFTLIRAIVISLALGGIIGLERESHREPDTSFGSVGVRTLALSAVLGTASVLAMDVAPLLPYLVGIGYFALLVAFFWNERRATDHEVGITTQISAMLVFVIGVLVPSNPLFAASIAVIVAIVLSLKTYTSRFVRLLTPEEIISTMKFLLITVVLLPLLPNETVDPFGFYNPREIWLLVVLISGISFLGYFAIRFLGPRRGLTLTGILGGMASSTAVTLAMSRQVHQQPHSRTALLSAAFAIMLANAFMFLRVSIAVAIINLALIHTLWIPFVLMAVPGTLIAALMWWLLNRHLSTDQAHDESDQKDQNDADQENDLDIQNPFELAPALKFALLLTVIIGAANFLQEIYGTSAIYIASIFGGLAETNAISLAIARLENQGELSPQIATRAIVIAILANSFVKAALASIIGSRKLGLYIALGLIPILLVGLSATFFLI